MDVHKLAYMANQIGQFFVSQRDGAAVTGIQDHLRRFWDPRMRATIIAQLDEVTATLDPPVLEAVRNLKAAAEAAPRP